jgi:adenylate cyclase
VVSDALVQQARTETSHSSADFVLLVEQPAQIIRGLEQPVGIWTCANVAS